jgi:hypothetical protein
MSLKFFRAACGGIQQKHERQQHSHDIQFYVAAALC